MGRFTPLFTSEGVSFLTVYVHSACQAMRVYDFNNVA